MTDKDKESLSTPAPAEGADDIAPPTTESPTPASLDTVSKPDQGDERTPGS
jgi:hypothetical protein